jgi:hypothetical protein
MYGATFTMLGTRLSSSSERADDDTPGTDAPSDSGEHARIERDVPAHSDVRALSGSRFARAWRQRERVALAGADWALDAGTLLFALWTLCCHLTVLRHGSGTRLFVTFAVALPVALFALSRLRIAPAAPSLALPPVLPEPRVRDRLPWRTLIGGAGALAVVHAWRQLHDPWYFWLLSVAFLLISCALVFSQPAPASARLPARLEPWQGWLLWLLGVASAAYTALLNRPNSDDALYVNIAATLRDHPEYELFSGDTLHGHGMTLMRAYAASSVELFAGFLAWLTHTAALKIMHLSLGPVAGLLTAFALARLFRWLEPERWLWLVMAALAFYVVDGASELTVAGHGFIRMFQGKAMLATMGVPLIAANAIAFASSPSRWRWLTFAASLIMGIGLSSTGIWLALLVGATGLVVPLRFDRAYLEALAWGGLALLYPLLFALWMRSQLAVTGGAAAFASSGPHTWAEITASAARLKHELFAVALGNVALYVALLLLAWPLARNVLLRRYLVLFALGGFALLLNPVLASFVAANLTGHATYSRVLWYLPFAVAFATCFGAAMPTNRRGALALIAGGLVTAGALGWFALENPKLSTLPYVSFPPAEKVNLEGCKVSRYLARNMDDQSVVLAPVAVSLCLPMVQHSPYALMTKPKFFDNGGGERFALRRVIDGGHRAMFGLKRRNFIGALQGYGVRGVVLMRGVEEAPGMVGTLEIAGFHEAQQFPSFIVYLRDEPWPPKA